MTNSVYRDEEARRAIWLDRNGSPPQVGIIQTLICTCRLQGVDPYTYLVDVLQRVSTHPVPKYMSHELTPRYWKELFAQPSLRT